MSRNCGGGDFTLCTVCRREVRVGGVLIEKYIKLVSFNVSVTGEMDRVSGQNSS